LLQDKNCDYYPILIEYKGYKDKLVKLDEEGHVANKNSKNEPDFKNINSYAVNGAVHYANAILHYTNFTDIIAIGMTGFKNDSGKLEYSIGVYYVSKSNFGVGQKVDEYTDFSFLKKENFDAFIEKVRALSLSDEEKEKLKEKREQEIGASLVKLNNDIYQNEKGLGENDRVYLVAASIIATLGIPKKVSPLEKDDLKSSLEEGNRDGDIVLRKINAFLKEKQIPKDKKDLIVRTLANTLTTENINKVENGESQLKRVFSKIIDDLGIYYKTDLTTDFTGKLFNEMYSWLGFTQDKLNDVVLTPSYVATLLVKLARVNKDSFVWDFATGSAGLLVAAMNEMLDDAKKTLKSPEEINRKSAEIKAKQLLGLEILSNIYMLATLNMILMGDGSSNILNKDSLNDFDGKYGFGNTDDDFPADAFVLNPPYSAKGNGMIFVEKALSMMKKGYAAIIIQGSAGSGKAVEYNKKILEKNTLLASIKMPIDLFVGKSSVQTYVYVFKIGEAHEKDETVKFIDFSNDGYTRTNRKKANVNLRDTDNAKGRYAELVDLVRFGKKKLSIFTEQEYYEGTIDPQKGDDWNQSAPVDTKPTLEDFKKTVADYLAWEVSNIIKNNGDNSLGK
ncbi:MAG: SAM-dependent methyltransferase, partial [Treponema sp.]|uniref:HsdM family class I SAM-dependent methyltransferase n=1 Tax=Treponema sp. TaxID=166 RepID=UPI00298D659F